MGTAELSISRNSNPQVIRIEAVEWLDGKKRKTVIEVSPELFGLAIIGLSGVDCQIEVKEYARKKPKEASK